MRKPAAGVVVVGNTGITDDLIIFQYKNMQGKDQIEFNGAKINRPVTSKVDKLKTNVAVLFNKSLFNLCESDYNLTEASSRASFSVTSSMPNRNIVSRVRYHRNLCLKEQPIDQ